MTLSEKIHHYNMLILDDMEHWEKGDWYWMDDPTPLADDETEAWEALKQRWNKAFKSIFKDELSPTQKEE